MQIIRSINTSLLYAKRAQTLNIFCCFTCKACYLCEYMNFWFCFGFFRFPIIWKCRVFFVFVFFNITDWTECMFIMAYTAIKISSERATNAHKHPTFYNWNFSIPQLIIMTLQRATLDHYSPNGFLSLNTAWWCVCKQPLCILVSLRFLWELPVRAFSMP